MHIWTDLLTREAVFLLTLVALGAAPACLLSSRFDGATRLALAPAFGLCLGVALTTTLVRWEPVRHTYWVVIVVALVSLAVSVWRTVRVRGTFALQVRELLQIILIAVVVLGVPTSTLHARHTVGPVALNVYDAAGYIAEIDSQQTRSIQSARTHFPPYSDLEQGLWSSYAAGFQNLDVSALEGSVNDILGLDATDTQSSFMIVILLVGALGAFAAVRYVSRSRSWTAVLAGALFGGSFFLQLWGDSSEAALCGLAVLLPFMIVGAEALRTKRLRDCALLGLASAGLLTLYPLFVPCVAIGSAVILTFLGARALRRGRPTVRQAGAVVIRLTLVLALAAGLAPVAFGRDLRYWRAILSGGQPFGSLPVYHLPIGVLPGWLLQTRQFYFLAALGRGGLKEFVFAVVVPAVMLGIIVVGLLYRRISTALLAFAGACFVLALYVALHNHCSYCTQRNLLPVGPMASLAVGLGVAGLFARGGRVGRLLGVIAAVIVVVFVAARVNAERKLVLDTAYFLDSANRTVLAHLPPGDPTVQVEGYGANLRGPGEMPLVYDLVNERTHGHASIAIDAVDYSSFAYLGAPPQPRALDPAYQYVLTRFGGVGAGRSVLARSGGIALERRAEPLDVTPTSGLGSPLARLDPGGNAWVQGSALPDGLGFDVVGGRPGTPAWLHLEMATEEPVGVPRQPGVISRLSPNRLSVCVRMAGPPPVRHRTIGLSFTPIAGPEPHELYTLPAPAEGVELLSMTTSVRRCVP
jgi:hypothetical protein